MLSSRSLAEASKSAAFFRWLPPTRLVIEEYRLLPCDYAACPSYTLSEQDELRLRELLAAPR